MTVKIGRKWRYSADEQGRTGGWLVAYRQIVQRTLGYALKSNTPIRL
jgi:hypothetical protein